MRVFWSYCAVMLAAGVAEVVASIWAFSEQKIALGVCGLLIAIVGVPANIYLASKVIKAD